MKRSLLMSATALVCALSLTTSPDRAAAEAVPVAETRPIVLFSADDGIRGTELWVTDGTRRGTERLADLLRGPVGSHPSEITLIADNLAVFRAEHPRAGVELWVTDGTAEGTQLVRNITGDGGSSWPWGITPLGDGRALFSATDPGAGTELWVTDATRRGTQMVRNINPEGDSWPTDITALGDGTAVFAADHRTHGRQVWITDGTRQGTSMVRNINPGGSHPWGFVKMDDHVLFAAMAFERGSELWRTDGTRAGTRLVRDINPGGSSWPEAITPIGDGLAIFTADDGTRGAEPWITDGTRAGTQLLRNINRQDDMFGMWPGMYTPLGNGQVIFAADDGVRGVELWVTDGTRAGTGMVRDINPGPDWSLGMFMGHKVAEPLGNGLAVFFADDGEHGLEPWVTDGTRRGTRLLADTMPGEEGGAMIGENTIFALGDGRALFTANSLESGVELWVTDGTPRGTQLLRDINRGPDGSFPDGFMMFGAFEASHPLVMALDAVALAQAD